MWGSSTSLIPFFQELYGKESPFVGNPIPKWLWKMTQKASNHKRCKLQFHRSFKQSPARLSSRAGKGCRLSPLQPSTWSLQHFCQALSLSKLLKMRITCWENESLKENFQAIGLVGRHVYDFCWMSREMSCLPFVFCFDHNTSHLRVLEQYKNRLKAIFSVSKCDCQGVNKSWWASERLKANLQYLNSKTLKLVTEK